MARWLDGSMGTARAKLYNTDKPQMGKISLVCGNCGLNPTHGGAKLRMYARTYVSCHLSALRFFLI